MIMWADFARVEANEVRFEFDISEMRRGAGSPFAAAATLEARASRGVNTDYRFPYMHIWRGVSCMLDPVPL